MPASRKSNPRIVSALTTRTKLGQILRRVKSRNERFLIQQGGQPQAIVMSVEDYINVVAPAPEWLEEAWKAAEENGADEMSMREVDDLVADVRRDRQARKDAAPSGQ